MSNQITTWAIIKELTGQNNVLTVPRVFIDFMGSIDGALFLSQCLYWSDKSKDPGGWFFKSYNEWEDEICLSKYEVNKHRAKMEEFGILETKLKKAYGAPTLHYRIPISDFEKWIVKKLNYRKLKNLTIHSEKTSQSLTETTTETTPENGGGENSDKPDIIDGMIKYANQETGQENVAEPSAFDKHFGGYRDVVLNIWWEKVGRQAQGQLKDDLIDLSRLDNFDPDKFTEFFEKYIRAGGSPYAFDKIKAGYSSHSPQTRRTKTQTFKNKYTGETETVTL